MALIQTAEFQNTVNLGLITIYGQQASPIKAKSGMEDDNISSLLPTPITNEGVWLWQPPKF